MRRYTNRKLEVDTDLLYLALSEHDLYDCIRWASRKYWNSLRSGDSKSELSANSTTNFLTLTCCAKHKKHEGRQPVLFKEQLGCTELIGLCNITYCYYDSKSNKFKFRSKGLNKRTLEDSGDERMSKYRKFWKRLSTQRQQVEIFAQYNMLLPHMCEQRTERLTFIPEEMLSKVEHTLVP